VSARREEILRCLPQVEEVLQAMAGEEAPRRAVLEAVRMVLSRARAELLECADEELDSQSRTRQEWLQWVLAEARRVLMPSLRPLINATGVIVHTNLGRSLLAPEAVKAVVQVASWYSNLEFDLEQGRRGSRQSHLEGLLRRLTGAEAATVVNNNAAAVLICLSALARGREVVVSRGELVEIGGSFRMPDVMAHSGARLVEVGTTNKTHPVDYEAAISQETALLLKVHTSNYRILGFTRDVSLQELVALGRRAGVPVMYDLGSGCLVDLKAWTQEPEPTVQEALAAGVDLVTFSGDKLLGGPQAGIILGRRDLVESIRRYPLARALRIDKLTLAALQATLELYWDPHRALESIPTLNMMSIPAPELLPRARRLARLLRKQSPHLQVHVREDRSRVGGGALPLLRIPTWVVGVSLPGTTAQRLGRALREQDPPVVARVAQEELLLDLRTIDDRQIPLVAKAVARSASCLAAEK
jgi:L-seryl-tRNA(Ser) seleniumtransferase